VLATSAGGSDTWGGGFEPFGADYSEAKEAGVFLRFPGQWENQVWEGASDDESLYYNVHRWYDSRKGRYTRADPYGVVDGGPNLYQYAYGRPLIWLDPLGQEILVCSRPCCGGFGWHSYLWDDRPGIPADEKYCGGFSDKAETGPGPGVNCTKPIPGSKDKEDEAMDCCDFFKKWEPPPIPLFTYIPGFIDCSSQLDRALTCAGLDNPGVPGGRLRCKPCYDSGPSKPFSVEHRIPGKKGWYGTRY
jgi:RHS repeat-associated protein